MGNGKQFFLSFVQKIVHIVVFGITESQNIIGGVNHIAEHFLSLDYFGIRSDVSRAWNGAGERGDIADAAGFFKKLHFLQFIG